MLRLIPATALGVALLALPTFADEAPIVPISGTSYPTAMPGSTYPTAMPTSGYAGPVGETVAGPHEVIGQRYGLLPFLRKGVFWKKNYGACESCEGEGLVRRLGGGLGHGGGLGGGLGGLGHGGGLGLGGAGGGGAGGAGFPGQGVPGVPQPGQPGMGMPGTLVFPYNPYIRSPRDYFMYETK